MNVDDLIEQLYLEALAEIELMASVARKQTEARFATLRRSKGQLFRRRN